MPGSSDFPGSRLRFAELISLRVKFFKEAIVFFQLDKIPQIVLSNERVTSDCRCPQQRSLGRHRPGVPNEQARIVEYMVNLFRGYGDPGRVPVREDRGPSEEMYTCAYCSISRTSLILSSGEKPLFVTSWTACHATNLRRTNDEFSSSPISFSTDGSGEKYWGEDTQVRYTPHTFYGFFRSPS